jgi:predicted AAA+ superfamily ATPase
MYPRLFKPLKTQSFFLFGPRATGKTSYLKTNIPEARYFDLLDDATYREFLAAPERIEARLEGHKPSQWIVIDEIQRVPALLNHVHRLIENRKFKFVLTGSSARKLRAKGVNLLAGRAVTEHFFPLVAAEIGTNLDIKKSLRYGHLPFAYDTSEPDSYLNSYVSTYLREEVQQEGLVRNLSAFSRFLESASYSQGCLLNVSAVARDCSIERKVVESYFEILEDLLIAFRLSVFAKKAKRKLVAQRKFYFFDAGVYQAIRPRGPLDSEEEIQGPALETLFIQEVRALNSYLRLGYGLFFWHTTDHKNEVDLVCYGKRNLLAFEIKRSARVRDEDLESLRLFKKDYNQAKTYFIYGGTRRDSRYGIEIIPFSEAIKELKDLL